MENSDLALAASRTRLVAEYLSGPERDELIAEWGRLVDETEDAPPADADSALAAYRASLDERLEAFTLGARDSN
jgi:hypothetical protein